MSIPQSFAQWQEVMDPLYGGWRDRAFNMSTGGMMLYDGWFYPYGKGVWVKPPQYIGNGYWRVSWVCNGRPPVTFYVWVNGKLQGTTQQYLQVFFVAPGDILWVDVFDDEDDRPAVHYPRELDIFWPAAAGAAKYQVQYYDAPNWVTVHERLETGQMYYEWTSPRLADVTGHQFRVVAIGSNENSTTLRTMSAFMVGRPDHQSVEWSYDDETRKVSLTIT